MKTLVALVLLAMVGCSGFFANNYQRRVVQVDITSDDDGTCEVEYTLDSIEGGPSVSGSKPTPSRVHDTSD